MPRSTFDDLSKAVAAGTSRRSLLRGLLGAAAGAVALTGRDSGAQSRTVGICHKSWAWSSDWRYITLDARDERRIDGHLDHGDTVDPDFDNDPNHCGGCGNACEAPENASASCFDGWCDFNCNSGYQWNGEACVEIAPPTCPSYSTPDGYCYHLNNDVVPGLWCWSPANPQWLLDNAADCAAAGWNCSGGGGCFEWRTSAP